MPNMRSHREEVFISGKVFNFESGASFTILVPDSNAYVQINSPAT